MPVEKVPPPPDPDILRNSDLDLVTSDEALWRIHFRGGSHPTQWNQLRKYGPLDSRFDPHPAGSAAMSTEGVAYTAAAVPTSLAEVFQASRTIDLAYREPWLVGWQPIRKLQLLDLTGGWPLRVGASFSINSCNRARSRQWARAFRAAWPDVDGAVHTSSLTGQRCLVLWNPARDSFPGTPGSHHPLTDPDIAVVMVAASEEIGYTIL